MPKPRRRAPFFALIVAGIVAAVSASCSSASPTPRVDRVDPPSVLAGGTAFVLVEGSGFDRAATLTIGNAEAITPAWINSSLMTGIAPASLAAGAYDVLVRNPDGKSSRLVQGLQVGPGRPLTPGPTLSPVPKASSTPTPTPTPMPSPTPTPSPSPTPTPSPTPQPTPSPTPSPSPTATALPQGTLERLVCQLNEFGNSNPSAATHVSNQQVADEGQDPTMLQTLTQLGRQDGYRVTYNAFPGERASANPRAFTTCYVEVYSTADGARAALQGISADTFPSNVQVREVQAPAIGEGTRLFEGTITDSQSRQQIPLTVLIARRGRFITTVEIERTQPLQSSPAAQRLSAATDMRIAQVR